MHKLKHCLVVSAERRVSSKNSRYAAVGTTNSLDKVSMSSAPCWCRVRDAGVHDPPTRSSESYRVNQRRHHGGVAQQGGQLGCHVP